MIDPVTGTVVGKVVKAASSDTEPIKINLLQKVFGPPAEELGIALGRLVEYRCRNFGRIVEKASKRAKNNKSVGAVNPRFAFLLLQEGSLCDDELMADYLGGLLADSKSPDGRDDRAITWCHIITSLSSFQIRAHYLMYREWAYHLHQEAPEIDLSYVDEMNLATMHLDFEEFTSALMQEIPQDPEVILRHSMMGLARIGLINDSWSYGKHIRTSENSPFENEEWTIVSATPTGRGMELYGWAFGMPDILPRNFSAKASGLQSIEDIQRLEDISLPYIHEQEEEEEEDFSFSEDVVTTEGYEP